MITLDLNSRLPAGMSVSDYTDNATLALYLHSIFIKNSLIVYTDDVIQKLSVLKFKSRFSQAKIAQLIESNSFRTKYCVDSASNDYSYPRSTMNLPKPGTTLGVIVLGVLNGY